MSVMKPAEFSEDRKYRYTLVREFLTGEGTAVFILLNPSTADESSDDPTVRRCIGYTKHWGYRRLIVVNSFALRSTDPKALYLEKDPIGPDNDAWIMTCAKMSNVVVCGWGPHGILNHRSFDLRHLLVPFKPKCLGKTRDGEPRHPLYLRGDAPLIDL